MTTVDLTFTAPNRPTSINQAQNLHWAARRSLLEPWKDATWAAAHNHRLAFSRGPVRVQWTPDPITVQVVLPFRTSHRRDAHNYTGTVVKAVVDGIVRAGLVPDDTPEWVTVLDPEFSIQRDPYKPLTATVRIRPRSTT